MGDKNVTDGAPGVTAEDLEKSLEQLEQTATEGDTPSRKEALLTKAASGDLEKAERDELFELLGGNQVEPTSETGEELVKGLEGSEPLQKALDVSDFLKEQHDELCKSLRAVGDAIEQTDNRRHNFNLVMAKAIHDIGYMVKSMSENIDAIMEAPTRAPRSRGVRAQPPKVLQKSFGGQQAPGGNRTADQGGGAEGGEEYLSKSEILSALQGMNQQSLEKGMNGKARCGEDLLLAVAKYEQTNRISPKLYRDVERYVTERTGAAH